MIKVKLTEEEKKRKPEWGNDQPLGNKDPFPKPERSIFDVWRIGEIDQRLEPTDEQKAKEIADGMWTVDLSSACTKDECECPDA